MMVVSETPVPSAMDKGGHNESITSAAFGVDTEAGGV